MRVRDITVDMPFRFTTHQTIYISRGNGWYNTPGGHAGGPWHDCNIPVEEVPTTLHSHSFDGLNQQELEACAQLIIDNSQRKYDLGDLALIRYEFLKRELDWAALKPDTEE